MESKKEKKQKKKIESDEEESEEEKVDKKVKKSKKEDSDDEEEEKVEKKSKKAKKEESDNEEEEEGVDKRAFPLANKVLTKELFQVINKATQIKKIKKGANEATKTLNRGVSDLIIMAADAKPLEIVLHLPLLCEAKNVPYVFVESQKHLGRACGVSRPVIACSILTETSEDLQKTIQKLKGEIEKILI